MPNIASLLKDEIGRVARKEIRKQTVQLKRLSASHRRHIAALKRQVVKLERDLNVARRRAGKSVAGKSAEAGDGRPGRFVAKGLRSLRTRLGLSAAEFAKLVGVTGQTIYNWEQKKASPRNEQLAVLTSLRGLGKRDVQARLNEAGLGEGAERKKRGRPAKKASAKKATRKTGKRKYTRRAAEKAVEAA